MEDQGGWQIKAVTSIGAADGQVSLRLETPEDQARIEAIMNTGFGPGRFAKSAERLREGNSPLHALCLLAETGAGEVVGSVRLWPVHIDARADGTVDQPLCFLGPIAVDPGHRSKRTGAQLIEAVVLMAFDAGYGAIILVGDEGYFSRFGFMPFPELSLPGPVDPQRILGRMKDGTADIVLRGRLEPGHAVA